MEASRILKHLNVIVEMQARRDIVSVPFDLDDEIRKMKFFRFTGSTPGEKIDSLVSIFTKEFDNKFLESMLTVFLLSISNEYPYDVLERFIHSLIETTERSMVVPGDALGLWAGEALTESTTQGVLNTFHHSGVGQQGATMGLPRFDEILRCTKKMKTPRMILKIKRWMNNPIDTLERLLCTLNIEDVVKDVKVSYRIWNRSDIDKDEVGDEDDEQWIVVIRRMDKEKLRAFTRHCKYEVSLLIDPYAGATIDSIINAIKRFDPEVKAISSYGLGRHVILLRSRMIEDSIVQKMTETYESDINSYNPNTDLTSKKRQCIIKRLLASSVRQPSNIRRVFPHTRDHDAFELDGVDYDAIFRIGENHIFDWRKIVSNDFYHVKTVFGIEACREVLYRELLSISSSSGSFQESRHMSLLADSATYTGTLLPFDRYGLRKRTVSYMRKATFEESVTNFVEGMMHCARDPMTGCSERLMIGSGMIRSGTGIMDGEMILDEKCLETYTTCDDDGDCRMDEDDHDDELLSAPAPLIMEDQTIESNINRSKMTQQEWVQSIVHSGQHSFSKIDLPCVSKVREKVPEITIYETLSSMKKKFSGAKQEVAF